MGNKEEEWAWIPDRKHVWIPGRVISRGENRIVYEDMNGKEIELSAAENLKVIKFPRSALNYYTQDLLSLEKYRSEPFILYHLSNRYFKSRIYTWLGHILISINPYQEIPLYSTDIVTKYNSQDQMKHELPPHIFQICKKAIYQLKNNNLPQAIIITGQSGSGKTEASKQSLQFFVQAYSNSDPDILKKLLMTNVLLECFGNAKTILNNNSSRFGKWIELKIDSYGKILHAVINTFLLEKSRIVNHSNAERGYYIYIYIYHIDFIYFICSKNYVKKRSS